MEGNPVFFSWNWAETHTWQNNCTAQGIHLPPALPAPQCHHEHTDGFPLGKGEEQQNMVSANCGISGRNSDEAFTEKSLRRHLLDAEFVNTVLTSGNGWEVRHTYFAYGHIILNFIFCVFFPGAFISISKPHQFFFTSLREALKIRTYLFSTKQMQK